MDLVDWDHWLAYVERDTFVLGIVKEEEVDFSSYQAKDGHLGLNGQLVETIPKAHSTERSVTFMPVIVKTLHTSTYTITEFEAAPKKHVGERS